MDVMILFSIIIIIILLNYFSRKEKFTSLYPSLGIRFLTKNDASTVFDNFDALKYYQPLEIKLRSNGKVGFASLTKNIESIRKIYKNNVVNFTKKETLKIIRIVHEINNMKYPIIKKWQFLKMSGKYDWNLPYTINSTIILPASVLNNDDLKQTLFHEQFHVLQYLNPLKFNRFYTTKWNFSKILTNGQKNQWIKNRFVTNPDGYRNYYTYKTRNGTILPLVLLINKKMNGVGIYLNRKPKATSDLNILEKNGVPVYKKLGNISEYYKKFPFYQNYHPHEIFACMMVKCAFDNKKMDTDTKYFVNSLIS